MSSRTTTTGDHSRPGSHRTVTKYASGAEIVRLPSGSIVAIPPLEPIDLSEARLNKAVVFALAVNIIAWGFILLAGRAIAAVFL